MSDAEAAGLATVFHVQRSRGLAYIYSSQIIHISTAVMSVLFYEEESNSTVVYEEDGPSVTVSTGEIADTTKEGTISVARSQVAIRQTDVVVVDSIRAGRGRSADESGIYAKVIKPVFNDVLQVKHTYFSTHSHTAIQEFASTLVLSTGRLTVVVIGGDTSVNEIINNVGSGGDRAMDLVVIPAGTGNSLALSIGSGEMRVALQKLFTHTTDDLRPLNVYYADLPRLSYILQHDGKRLPAPKPFLFTVVASWAFHASLVADSDSDEMRKFGIERFQVAAKNNLSRRQLYAGSVQVGGVAREGPFAYFVVTPARKFEPTFEILPKGDILDDSLWLLTFATEDDALGSYIMDIMMQVYDGGKHIYNDKVHYDEVSKKDEIVLDAKELESIQERRFCIDGAIVVVPDHPAARITFGHHGSTVNGWKMFIAT